MKKALSLILALVMLIGMLPQMALPARAEEIVSATNELEGKMISILGASISTYTGISNNTAYNSTIGNNAVYYTEGRYGVYANDTWWMQVANDLGLRLLVNNSWSGSSLLYERNGTVGAYVDRCVQLHDDTGDNAGEMPDIIGIQMGTNDFQYYKDTLGTADIDYATLIADNGDGTYTYAEPVTSLEAAAIVLHKISVRYPNAEVYYLNISQRVDGTDELIRSFNAELKQVVEHFGAHIVDIYGSAITMENFDTYIGDGRVHPNKLGMDAYTEAFKRALLENTAYAVGTHTVSMNLDGITADYGDDKIVVSGDSFACKLTAEGGKELSVSVTMGGSDITDTAYEDGTVSIESVTADVVITAEAAEHVFQNYRWELDGTDLACVSGDNALTKNAGTTTDGVFSKTCYTMESNVVLLHDLPWAVEWKCEGTFQNTGSSSGARVFTSTNVNAEYNARYIFKSNTNGIIAMGEKTSSGSHNYGIALGDYGIDWTALHTYRLENHISDDGSNMIYLFVDGEEIGPMNHYYIGTKNQDTTSDWLSGKDFVFPYMGTDTHGFTNASIEYIQVWEGGKNTKSVSMNYDDHLDMVGKLVEIVDAGTPNSYQVGYGVEENTVRDTAVVTLEGNTLVATGIGTAAVMVDGETYEITVTAAPISLLLLIGQSNMQGSEGNADQSIACPDGMVYSTYGDRYTMTTDNATNFAPSALTGEGSALNVNGTTTNLEDWPVYLLNEAGAGKAGPDSGYAYEWVKQTGEKVWIVNAAHGGTSISVWQKGTTQYEECLALFSACQETLRKEIAAGHFTLSHTGYFWCQGCTDETQTAEWYVNKFLSMHESLNQDLSTDIDGDGKVDPLEFANITVTLAGHVNKTGYRYDDSLYDATDSTFFMTYEELEMRGQRVAQYWLAGNLDYPEINMVCNIGERWVTMPDGTDGVAEYFSKHYEDGIVDYTTQVQESSSWYVPATSSAVKDSIHYNQIGYNEVGIEAARNTLILLGEVSDSTEETTVRFVDWTGYREVSAISASTAGNSGTLVVPIVYPCYRSKSVAYQVSEGLNYSYYDLLADSEETTGTLTAIGASGSVDVELGHYWSAWETVCVPSVNGPGMQMRVCSDCGETETKEINGVWQTLKLSEHMAAMPDEYCCATNLWTAMEHDKYFFNGTSSWNIHASGTVYSVTIPINAGDQIFATSFGAADENGGTKNGIRFTFFNADGVAKTFAPADTYAEFMKNGGYMIAPEGAVAANIAMWTNSDDNELYILNRDHCYENGICTACGAEHPNMASYEGKVISILGDSISTFAGYIPAADGFNLEHLARYPQDNLLTDVNETWWMQVISAVGAKLGINDSWRGATVSGAKPVTTGTTGENAAMGNLQRIRNLGANGTPDVILFYGGTNDFAHVLKVGTFDPANAPSTVDLTTTKWDNLADGYVHTLLRLKHFYPEAQIIAMLPTYTNGYYSDEKLSEGNAVLAAICEHYGVTYVDLRECGITTAQLPDNIHPDATGMDYITEAVLDVLLNECDVEAGENMVYSVTHKLIGAESSLGYYKGVTHGKPFEAHITGEDVKVTVNMGGVDITNAVYTDGVVAITEVTGDIVITAEGRTKTVYEDHLQQLPEAFCAGTNLWVTLEHDAQYYTANGWGIHSSGTVYSVTFPVSVGDRIYATSFGSAGNNGGSINGIRVTWFDENGVLESVGADKVYAEFSANGYLVVPEGAVVVSIPMWKVSDDNEIYILNRDHCYENGICTACGTKHPNLQNYNAKVISILGGSTCTFDGYIPIADGFNLTHRPRYPQSNLLTDVNDTWWMQVIAELGAKLGINDSWAGSQVLNTLDSNSGDLGPDAAMASLTRIQNLGANGTPDIILFYGAMNDIGRAVTMGSFDPVAAPTQADLTATKWDNLADAYVAAIMRMQHYYPDAQIVAILPGPTASYYTEAERKAYGEVLKAICDHYGVPTVDLSTCGLTTADMPDGTHPNAEGMDYITEAVMNVLLNECEMEAGENVVHSVTHELSGAESSLGYYKGVSDGKSFVTTITGEDVTVTVTMDGVDITDQVYADGMIAISAVTGDVVITAKGVYNADGRLQQLPDSYCCNTNLWTLLEPVNEYYTASGWGNNSNSNYSVTFPVTAGDRIWATSFGAAGSNGYSANAVRITWFGEDDVLKSLGRDVVYSEFAEYGYITVPEGAVAVNIPMVSNADTWEIYILNRDHCYENGVCLDCGAAQPGPVITQQPVDTETVMGDTFCVTVEAEGESLKYQWYFRNAGSETWNKSGVKDNTYDDVMTTARAGREIYCVITDANGNSVTTETAKLICTPSVALEIVTQPTNGEAVLGERYCVTVEAKGDGLKYQWYFRNAGSEIWYKSGVTDNTYDDMMTTARAGREVYCVVTDAYGNSVKTDVVKLIRTYAKLEITSQPTDATAAFGEMFCATVGANGEGLKYQWYYRNAGSDTWHKSGVRDNTYDDIMTKARNGREIYCVITDAYGNTATTDVVKLTAVPKVELKVLGQSYESAAMGERYCVTVEAQGEGLTYQWYFRNAGSNTWYKSGVTDNTYDDVMTKARANREVYCVITDAFGNQIITEEVTLVLTKD